MQNPGSETFLLFFCSNLVVIRFVPAKFPKGVEVLFLFFVGNLISQLWVCFFLFFCFFVAGSVGSEIKPWGFVDVIGLIGPVTYHSDTHM